MTVLFELFTETYTHSIDARGNRWCAQTFTPIRSHTISYIQIYCERLGNPGTITVSIEGVDANGKPDGSALATGTFNGNDLATSLAWTTCTLTACRLVASTKYAIVWKALAGDSSNSISAGLVMNGATMYATGSRLRTSDAGANWTLYDGSGGYSDDDHLFRDYGVGVTLPSDAITRVTSLIHRYDRGTYTLEMNLGEVIADFGLPEPELRPKRSTPETEEEVTGKIREEDDRRLWEANKVVEERTAEVTKSQDRKLWDANKALQERIAADIRENDRRLSEANEALKRRAEEEHRRDVAVAKEAPQ